MSHELPPPRIQVERLRRRLLRQAELFDDPETYAAGVEDAIEAVIHLDEPEGERLAPAGGWFG